MTLLKQSECICVTRWLPEDIASSVCDLDILDDVMGVSGGRLLVHPHLHGKYYSNGRDSLVGSANLKVRGLGWHNPSNGGLGLRSIGRILGFNHVTVYRWIKAFGKKSKPLSPKTDGSNRWDR